MSVYNFEELSAMRYDTKLRLIGLPDNAREFAVTWLKEYEFIADEVLFYDYCAPCFYVTTEEKWADELDYLGYTETEADERGFHAFRDSSFEGVLVVGDID